jgi:tyrosyl-tRNA synthetase
MAVNTDNKKIKELLTRGVDEIIDRISLEKKLKSGKQLKIKMGVDPTSPNIHIGRSIPLLKLLDFQELGHKIILIIGDFTGVIGDTSDKESERPMLDDATVAKNMKNYIEQVSKILAIKKCEIHYNSKWLQLLTYKEISRQANIFSVNNFIARGNISKRLDAQKRVSLREVLYPLMQAYDSVAVKADVEIGGTDQRFNILAGRDMQASYGQNPQDIILNPLIIGLDDRKMSSSWGNTINLLDSAKDMYGKIMSLGDELIIQYFLLTTRIDLKKIEKYKKDLENKKNPMDIKMALAYEITKFYHSDKQAKLAEDYFTKTFRDKKTPTEMPIIKPSAYTLSTALLESKLVTSKAESRRLVEQGGIKINQVKVNNLDCALKKGDIIQKGKLFFIKIG